MESFEGIAYSSKHSLSISDVILLIVLDHTKNLSTELNYSTIFATTFNI